MDSRSVSVRELEQLYDRLREGAKDVMDKARGTVMVCVARDGLIDINVQQQQDLYSAACVMEREGRLELVQTVVTFRLRED